MRAARAVLELGPRVVVAKQGEYGSAMFTPRACSACPRTRRPTSSTRPAPATPSRAASWATSPPTPTRSSRDELLRRAMAYGTALASFNVEAFGTERMQTLTADEVTERVADARARHALRATPGQLRGLSGGRPSDAMRPAPVPERPGVGFRSMRLGLHLAHAGPEDADRRRCFGSSGGRSPEAGRAGDVPADGGDGRARTPAPAVAARARAPRRAARTANPCRSRRRACARVTAIGRAEHADR